MSQTDDSWILILLNKQDYFLSLSAAAAVDNIYQRESKGEKEAELTHNKQ
jgi:hypothetical protein